MYKMLVKYLDAFASLTAFDYGIQNASYKNLLSQLSVCMNRQLKFYKKKMCHHYYIAGNVIEYTLGRLTFNPLNTSNNSQQNPLSSLLLLNFKFKSRNLLIS